MNNGNSRSLKKGWERNGSMIKLNIEQQTDELRDIKEFIRDLHPVAVVELQSQQVRRLIYFAEKGIRAYRDYRTKLNPAIAKEITVDGLEERE